MRIVLTIPGSPNVDLASSLWRANLHAPLVAMGHDVVLDEEGVQPLYDLDPIAASTREPRARFSERWRSTIDGCHARAPVDLVITYVSASHLEPAAVADVRERVAPVVNFFCNNVHQFHLVRALVPAFSLNLVPERTALAEYAREGAEAMYWPMAANPDVYRPVERPLRYDAAFAGQRYGDRTALVCALREAGIDAHAFGPGWAAAGATATGAARPSPIAGGWVRDVRRLTSGMLAGRLLWRSLADRAAWERLTTRHAGALHGPVSDDDYVALFSESRVNLGFLALGDTHRTLQPLRQVRLREFEATMAGGFYLTGWIEELEELYVVGREIECYRSRAELIDKTRFYLRDDAARERVRRAGFERARRDHTWTRRFEALFAELGRRGMIRG